MLVRLRKKRENKKEINLIHSQSKFGGFSYSSLFPRRREGRRQVRARDKVEVFHIITFIHKPKFVSYQEFASCYAKSMSKLENKP